MNPFWLFCAGEDSGDILGESVVKEIREKGMDTVGAGGVRMQKAGLKAVVPFDDLPVSGFSDVLRNSSVLREHLKKLQLLLKNDKCQGLVAIDYPGFNLKLMHLALQVNKRVIYVEPPQIWAWKPQRVKAFLTPKARKLVELRALYNIEIITYRKYNLHVQKINHPFLNFQQINGLKKRTNTVLLFPGSRLSQAKRNLNLYLLIADKLNNLGVEPQFVVSRNWLYPFYEDRIGEKFPILMSPQSAEDRFELMRSASAMVGGPGSAITEAYLAKTPCIAASRIEPLTCLIGRLLLHTKHLTLPNVEADLVCNPPPVPEFVQCSFSKTEKQANKVVDAVMKAVARK